MKKYLLALAILLASLGAVRADNFCTDWGKFNLCLPVVSGVDAAAGYDFNGHQIQGLADTPIGKLAVQSSAIVLKFGGVTTQNGRGSPFLGLGYDVLWKMSSVDFQPGIYGGRDFNENAWFYGVKASVGIISPK